MVLRSVFKRSGSVSELIVLKIIPKESNFSVSTKVV